MWPRVLIDLVKAEVATIAELRPEDSSVVLDTHVQFDPLRPVACQGIEYGSYTMKQIASGLTLSKVCKLEFRLPNRQVLVLIKSCSKGFLKHGKKCGAGMPMSQLKDGM